MNDLIRVFSRAAPDRARRALDILRVAVAFLLFIHGVTRITLGVVDDFGVFLGDVGLPLGVFLAWTVTVVEIAGGATLAAGRLVRPLCAWFTFELIVGILLVHAPHGWFVVGAGRNGMEFSFLLIAVLIAVAWAEGEESHNGVEKT